MKENSKHLISVHRLQPMN